MKKTKITLKILLLSLIFFSCDLDKLTSLQDDFEISVNAEPVFSKLNIKIFNSKDGSDISEKVDISFSGTGSENIYTVNGTKNFKVEQGLITVGVNRNIVITDDNPLEINATVSANGYMTKNQIINIDNSQIQEIQISLMKIDDLPESTTLKIVTESLVNNKTTQEIKIEIPSKRDPEESLEVSIPADTEFYDENGNVMPGNEVRIDFQTFDNTIPTVDELSATLVNPETMGGGFNEFPGTLDLNENQPKSSSKKSLVGNYLVPIGSLYCIYYYVNGRRVYGVSRPTTFGFIVNRNRINPNTNRNVSIGDKITFYRRISYYYNSRLGDATIERYLYGNRYAYFRKTIPAGPGIYPYGFEVNPSCNTRSSINKITFRNNGRRTYYLYNVASKYNPNRSSRWGYMYFDGDYSVTNRTIRYWNNYALNMLGDDMILKVYYYSWQERRFKLVYDKEISKCDLDGQTIDISNQDCYQERDLDLSIKCPDANYLLNNLYVYYKKEDDRYWSYFDRISRSRLNGKSPCLENGAKYEFGFWYDGWKKTPPLTEQQMLNLYQNFDLPAICKAIKDL